MHPLNVYRVEGVQVDDGLDLSAIAHQAGNLFPESIVDGIGVEKKEVAAGEPDKRCLGTDVDHAANLEFAKDIPEIIRDRDDFV
jgi:hypothetical protein